jgi:REG-2-like HAD superfamily hydrolase
MAKMRPFKAVVFDVDGTLCSFSTGLGDVYAGVLAAHGVHGDPQLLNQSLKRTWSGFQDRYLNTADQYHTSPEREREVWLEFATKVLEDAGISPVGREHLVEEIYRSFSSPQGRTIEPGAVECLQALRSSGVVVAAATNNDIRTKEALNALGLAQYLDVVFVAAELSWKKPSPRYFETIAARLCVEPVSLVHVGNSLELDIVPAQKSGWSAVLYDPRGKGEEPRVGSLADLVRFLEQR